MDPAVDYADVALSGRLDDLALLAGAARQTVEDVGQRLLHLLGGKQYSTHTHNLKGIFSKGFH